ncbi:kinase-like domain-containing protein [Rhizophagus clarus]|uniref:Kinase-like domain-containing protein n=1 Tax=Rhizophagus clarus TaxID=94130 RepID=A0A8H3LU83_9GLOM|nr:kinase-like domain-containing protein [Rhizophagus clarus]
MTENDNISNPIEWIEDGISKKHIKYYEYEHFSNIEKIGNGGFGKVYRAKWKNMEQYLSSSKYNINNSLEHYLLVMEYADGGTLGEYLMKNSDNLYTHSSNILIHQNIVKLADFGLSQKIEEVTTSGVGVLLWEISSGQLPFKGRKDCYLMIEITQGLRETPVSNTHTDYVNLYTECWNGEPDKRPVMCEVVDRMKKFLFINDNTEIGYSNQIDINSLNNAIIARSQFSSDGLDKLVTNEVKLAIANLITLSQTEANVFSFERLNNLVTNEIKLAIDGITKTTHFKNKNEWNEWIEEAITKEYLKYYEYNNFNDVEKISSFEEVYRARWKNLDNYLALKSSGYNPERFVHELKIQRVAALHDNIIKFYGITVLEEGDKMKKYLLVREHADGGSLRNYLKENFNSLTWKNKIDVAYQLACAVSFLHVEGIIHRDLGSHIILIHKHTIKLAGFEYSKWIEDSLAVDPRRNLFSLIVQIPKGLRETPIPNTPTDYVNLYTECWNGEPDYRTPISEPPIKESEAALAVSPQVRFDEEKDIIKFFEIAHE